MHTEYLVRGLNCSSTCRTRDHATFGECMRSKRQMVGFAASARGADKTRDNLWNRELDMYAAARRQGIEPDGTGMAKIQFALDQSEKHGMAYGRDFQVAPDGKGGYDAVSHDMVKQVTAEIDKSSDMQTIRDSAKGIV